MYLGGSNFWKFLFMHKLQSETGEVKYSKKKNPMLGATIRFVSLDAFTKGVSNLILQHSC